MKNILVLCYQLSPTRGSEYSVAWNYVKNMSQSNRLTVLYGVSGEHLGDMREMEEYLSTHRMPNVTFVPVRPGRWAKWLNTLNERNIFTYSFYLAYSAWQRQVFEQAKRLVAENKFDLVHYLNPIGYREPGHLWKLQLPYMWGPINGMANYPSVMFDFQPLSCRIKYALRSCLNSLQMRFSMRVRRAIERTDLLLAATTECAQICERKFGRRAEYLPENGMTAPAELSWEKFADMDRQIRLIVVGSLDGRKNPLTVLKSLEYAKHPEKFHLDIIGDGPLRAQLEQYAHLQGLDRNITFHGLKSRDEVMQIFCKAHLHIVTSLGEGNPTTIWEAMSYGVPTLSVDHCGMHDTINPETGYLVGVSSSDHIARTMAQILDSISQNPEQLVSKAQQVVLQSEGFQWKHRVEFFEKCYDKCISNYSAKSLNNPRCSSSTSHLR